LQFRHPDLSLDPGQGNEGFVARNPVAQAPGVTQGGMGLVPQGLQTPVDRVCRPYGTEPVAGSLQSARRKEIGRSFAPAPHLDSSDYSPYPQRARSHVRTQVGLLSATLATRDLVSRQPGSPHKLKSASAPAPLRCGGCPEAITLVVLLPRTGCYVDVLISQLWLAGCISRCLRQRMVIHDSLLQRTPVASRRPNGDFLCLQQPVCAESGETAATVAERRLPRSMLVPPE
jgi:hypothetical protein